MDPARVASEIHGAVFSENGRFAVDAEATEANRARVREERKARAVPFKEWWKQERKKVASKENMDDAVVDMWRSVMALSPGYAAELRTFWALPEDFEF